MVEISVGEESTQWLLHEKLLCHRSKFFRDNFSDKEKKNSTMDLPDDENEPFRMFVGWLYSEHVPTPREEKDLGILFELYLMAEKWSIRPLQVETLSAVRKFYSEQNSYPGLRRVQYIYANTEVESPMRQLLVNSIARMLVLGDGIPQHWDKALRKNGQLAVDIILAVQGWKIEQESVPDAREESVEQIVDDKEQAKEIKQEGDGEETLVNGVDEDHKMSNGVEDEGEDEDEGKDDGEGEDEGQEAEDEE